ncbi:MAG: hypothetical protein AAB225_00125 [Acidobacteriota bacterium]
MRKHWVSGMLVVFLCGCGGGRNEKASPSADKRSAKGAPALKVSRDNPCSVMFPTEVEQILGVRSDLREIMDEVTCRYHFEQAGSGQSKPGRDETFIEVKVHWTDGRTAVTAARLAGKLLGGTSSGFEKLPGIGDEAWMAPMASYLAFSKGDAGVEIDMRMMPGEKEKAIRLAKLIASRL